MDLVVISNEHKKKEKDNKKSLMFILFLFLCYCCCRAEAGNSTSPPLDEQQQQKKTFVVQPAPGPPSPCLLDSYRMFNWVHIGYVPYFNISNRAPIFSTTDQCLDGCTADCSCTAVVYDVPHDTCYIYHDYIMVTAIEIHPVMPYDTMSVYLKVQRGGRGRDGYFFSSAIAKVTDVAVGLVLAAALAHLLLLCI